ncbi:MAG: hypothetical protein J6O88_12590 [Chryseobacterium sp.]|uniref:hypothetical protein n=1 Tax=Chryseobacterium sp. TaxID=1871047 RepID=UPI001B15D5B6|nr:hypothetical protein [Chryseobacterium sp.]MBO6185506.1 hypothetical protein [Chryseobacterium sp.]
MLEKIINKPMDHISYHGTNKENAIKIVGPPSMLDIEIGKGELGKGFYTGTSIALAAIWAQNRFPKDGVVIEFNISPLNFVKLRGHMIKTQADVLSKWKDLKKADLASIHTFGYDYIVAPFATIEEMGSQFKFESKLAEDELKLANKNIFLCGS